MAQELQQQLGDQVQIVAAFQNIAAGHLRDLAWQPDCDVLYTGDSKEAKATTLELIRAAGFFGVDAGPLANSSVVEGFTALLIGINARNKCRTAGLELRGFRDWKTERPFGNCPFWTVIRGDERFAEH